MSTPTRFDLNEQIARWRSQLLARESISSENVRELETHLRDTVGSLTSSNLTEEEAFFVAVRRLGTPEKLTEEFAKDDPSATWRNRIFWMAMALFLTQVLGSGLSTLIVWIGSVTTSVPLPIGVSTNYLILRFVVPFLWPFMAAAIGYGLLKGRFQGQSKKLAEITRSRKALAGFVLIPIIVLACLDVAVISQNLRHLSAQAVSKGMTVSISWMPGVIANFVWFTSLGITIYLLAPGRRAKVAE